MRNKSEILFEEYLKENNYSFETDYIIDNRIDNKNVDFIISSSIQNDIIFADVKEVRNSPKINNGEIKANLQIQNHIKNLRQKFSKKKVSQPIILITMNFSDCSFTGLTILRAMYGNLEMTFDKHTFNQVSDIHHSRKGNAEFTKIKNTLISGILVFNDKNGPNYFFKNHFAKNKITEDYFYKTKYLEISPYLKGKQLKNISSIML